VTLAPANALQVLARWTRLAERPPPPRPRTAAGGADDQTGEELDTVDAPTEGAEDPAVEPAARPAGEASSRP